MSRRLPDPEAEKLARAILTSRRTKCRVYGNHTEGGKCAGCGA